MSLNPIKLSINTPCHADWEKMSPEQNGRFCAECSLTVVDFTKMTDKEVQNYFINNIGKKTCGRLTADQLKRTQTKKSDYWESLNTSIKFYFNKPGLKTVVLSVFALLTFLPGCRRHSIPPAVGFVGVGDNFPKEQTDSLKTTILTPEPLDSVQVDPLEKRIPAWKMGDVKAE